MSRFCKSIALVMGVLLLPSMANAQASGCYSSTTDDPAQRLLSFSRFIAAETDAVSVQRRTRLGIPALDSTKVVLTTDAKTCASVVAAINAREATPNRARRVQVAALVRSGFFAYDGTTPAAVNGGSRSVYFITPKFVVKEVLFGL